MIREITRREFHMLKDFLLKDIARNYFLLLGISGTRDVYDEIYGEFHKDMLKAVLFRRKTGVLQFYAPGDFVLKHFVDLIKTLDYNSLIGPKSYCDNFLNKGIFQRFEDGAYLSKLKKNHKITVNESQYKIRNITIDDLDKVVEVYKEVFESFAPKEIMEKKLTEKRGRGVCIEIDGKIVSLAQSDFETKDGALIVGVATAKAYRGQGLGTECLKFLCNTLQKEGKDLFLQYHNLDAEGIYNRLGFKKFDQVMHYFKD